MILTRQHYHISVSDGVRNSARFVVMFSSDGSSADTILDGISILRADRQSCIICGHPTGDCVSHFGEAQIPTEVRVQFAPLVESRKEEEVIFVAKDVHKEVALSSMTKTRILVAKAGTYVTKSKAEELGII
jgi:hypothetical protein